MKHREIYLIGSLIVSLNLVWAVLSGFLFIVLHHSNEKEYKIKSPNFAVTIALLLVFFLTKTKLSITLLHVFYVHYKK